MKNWEGEMWCPWGNSVEKVIIENGITNIGDYAFALCYQLRAVEIPQSVSQIGDSPFSDCISLTNIKVSKNNKFFTDYDGVLYTKNGQEIIKYPQGRHDTEYAILNGTTIIRDETFYNCTGLTHIEIPESVINIGSKSFELCENLTNMELPDGVTSIGWHAFYNCRITNVYGENETIEEPNYLKRLKNPNDVLYLKSDIELYNCTIENHEIKFIDKTSEATIEVSNGLTYNYYLDSNLSWDLSKNGDSSVTAALSNDGTLTISGNGDMADFENDCSIIGLHGNLIEKVIIENGVTSIGSLAFGRDRERELSHITGSKLGVWANCIKSIEIPSSVTDIGDGAFYECKSLENVKIPSSVKNIGFYAFALCKSLEKIYIPESVIEIGEGVFSVCDKVTIICYKESTAKTYAQEEGIKYLIIMDEINPKTTVEQLSKSIGSEEQNEIKDKNGGIITNTAYVTTGSTVQMSNGESYIIIVTGDANGDGKADIQDIFAINKHRLNNGELINEYVLAGDPNRDGKININDIFQINID